MCVSDREWPHHYATMDHGQRVIVVDHGVAVRPSVVDQDRHLRAVKFGTSPSQRGADRLGLTKTLHFNANLCQSLFVARLRSVCACAVFESLGNLLNSTVAFKCVIIEARLIADTTVCG
jgi:hypothetical protein